MDMQEAALNLYFSQLDGKYTICILYCEIGNVKADVLQKWLLHYYCHFSLSNASMKMAKKIALMHTRIKEKA